MKTQQCFVFVKVSKLNLKMCMERWTQYVNEILEVMQACMTLFFFWEGGVYLYNRDFIFSCLASCFSEPLSLKCSALKVEMSHITA